MGEMEVAAIKLVRPPFTGSFLPGVAAAVSPAVGVPPAQPAPPAPGTILITATSTEDETPRARIVGTAFGLLVVAAIAVIAVDQSGNLPASLSLADNMNAFALFYLAAQGIERLLEPFTYFVTPTSDTKEVLDEKKGTALTSEDEDTALAAAADAANAKAKLSRLHSERSILFWALASVVGVIASAWLGLHFLSMILAQASQSAVPASVDVVVTGLVIGGGTKALHDLIGRISKPAEDGDDTASS